MNILIAGAGLSGLLAGAMLRGSRHDVSVNDPAPDLPRNHGSVLRFRDRSVADALNITFGRKMVLLAKAAGTHPRNDAKDAIEYGIKTTGQPRTDRSITRGMGEVERWIAPPDLVDRMAGMCDRIDLNTSIGASAFRDPGMKVITTLPMPDNLRMAGGSAERVLVDAPDFESYPAWHASFRVATEDHRHADAHLTVYVPAIDDETTRISVTGRRVFVELSGRKDWEPDAMKEHCATAVERHLGFRLGREPMGCLIDYTARRVPRAKILPVPDTLRKEALIELSRMGVYSLGRFATWRPGLVMCDLVNDVRTIMRMIEGDAGPDYDATRR